MPSTDELVKHYLRLRTALDEIKERHKQELAPTEEAFEQAANELLTICNTQNADSIKTSEGTVSRRVSSRYWTSDWERMYDFIRENDAPFLLEQRIHNSNMKQFLEDNPDKLPMGLQADRKYVIQVRKPNGR